MPMAPPESVKHTTPPAKIFDGPLTPPSTVDTKAPARVAAVLRAFKNPPSEPWTVYKLSNEEYEDLERRLKDDVHYWDYFGDKVVYDYDPIGSNLFIRTETTLHGTFARKVETKITEELENLKKNHVETRRFINKIESMQGAIHFEDDGKNFKHVPDLRFHHMDAKWPGVVIEVSYSTKRKNLIDLAENYLLTTNGGIRVMVGIDVEYKKAKEASISIWRLKISPRHDGQPEGEVIRELDNELFRDAEGNPIFSSAGLELPLDNFAVQALSNELPNCSVIVRPETLCTLLAKAEECHDKSTKPQGVEPAPLKRKHREITPEEQLTMSDEEKVIEEERRVRKKTEKADKTYGEE